MEGLRPSANTHQVIGGWNTVIGSQEIDEKLLLRIFRMADQESGDSNNWHTLASAEKLVISPEVGTKL